MICCPLESFLVMSTTSTRVACMTSFIVSFLVPLYPDPLRGMGLGNADSIKKTDKKFPDRLDEFYDHLKPRVAVDILVYTPEEFEKMKGSNQFIRHALKNGRILYEKQRR